MIKDCDKKIINIFLEKSLEKHASFIKIYCVGVLIIVVQSLFQNSR